MILGILQLVLFLNHFCFPSTSLNLLKAFGQFSFQAHVQLEICEHPLQIRSCIWSAENILVLLSHDGSCQQIPQLLRKLFRYPRVGCFHLRKVYLNRFGLYLLVFLLLYDLASDSEWTYSKSIS